MVISIRKINLYEPGREPCGRPRTGEAIIADHGDGWSKRFEFDYDDDFIYVYTSLFRHGQALDHDVPFAVRAIPRKRV